MPARARRQRSDDPIEDLGFLLKSMSREELAGLIDTLGPDDLQVVEHAFANVSAQGWRATPTTMMCQLDKTKKAWPYSVLLGERFRAAAEGKEAHQIWELPSQYGKTTHLIWGAIWLLDFNPTLRIMYVSYDADRAVEEGGRARDLAETHADVLSFRLRKDRRARAAWKTEQGGGLYATGIGGAITGFPQDVILADDLIKGWQAAHSEAQRDYVWSVYRSQIRLRVQSSKNPIIVAGTRWHEDDVAARLMKLAEEDPNGDQWSVLRLPAVAEEATPNASDPLLRLPDPLGREPGQVLEPERFDADEVRARAIALGSYLAAALEQQRPAPAEGGEILRAWWRFDDAFPRAYDDALTSWDMKLKDKEGGDFVVGQAWGRTGSDFWCADQLRGQWNLVTTKTAIALLAVRNPWAKRHVIENTGNGPEVMEQLRAPQPDYKVGEDVRSQLGINSRELPLVEAMFRRGIPGLVPENVKGDKVARMRAQTPYIEAGNVHLPSVGAWPTVFIDEHAAFPRSTHDDQVDACSQALKRLARGPATATAPPQKTVQKPKPGARSRTATIGRPGSRGSGASRRR